MTQFASTAASQKAKRSGLIMPWQGARTRFFCFFPTIGLFVCCLFMTPSAATAPQPKSVTPSLTETHANVSGHAKRETTQAPTPTSRERAVVQVGRDTHRTVVRHGRIKLSSRDIELLARLVYAEGRGEPYQGQVAIAAVVLNRVESPEFPDSVREVIFAKNAFSPVRNGHLPNKTNDKARKAVWDAINGKDPSKGSLYFYNPKTATSDWIRTRPQTVRIANHVFAR
jgi:N-acetylmuramoyl-L-alanine amidase